MEGKNIKVYGTLINQTLNTNSSMRDSQHNDLIAVAYQLYDERFNPRKGSGTNFAVTAIDRYQDVINKRLTAIYFDDKGTGDQSDDITYIDSNLNVGGTSVFDGPAIFNNNVNITGNINLNIGLNDLNDVVLSSMAAGQVLRYNGSSWVNGKLSLDDLQMPAASNGLVLKFNGTKWVAGTDESGGGSATNLADLNDVDIQNPQDKLMLIYNSSTNKWESKTIAGGSIGFVETITYNMQYMGTQVNPTSGFKTQYWGYPVSFDDVKRMLRKDVIIKYNNYDDILVLDGGLYLLNGILLDGDINVPANTMTYAISSSLDGFHYDDVASIQLILKLYKSVD